MFNDLSETYNSSGNADISVESNHSVSILLAFVDRSIPGFRDYFLALQDSTRENRVSDFLIYYFNFSLLMEHEGFPSFSFGKNPTQQYSGKETDIGVVVLTQNAAPVTIIEFEAKRLSDTSNNKEYVCGDRGGIDRFKRGHHASHLSLSGMFGYIQSKKLLKCSEKINGWIDDLATSNTDTTIDWAGVAEKLVPMKELDNVSKWSSVNSRKNKENIKLLHYLIDLTN
jgi:hypothetical protein